MARICIVTPGALGSNPRVVKEADALVRAGHDVHVIATRSLAVVDARDAAILAHAAWTCERIDLRTPANRIRRKLGEAAARLVNRLTGWAAAEAMSPLTALLQARALAHPADLYIAHYDPALPAAAHDLGLAAETGETTNHQMALANKLFTYLLAGVPVLLSDIPGHRAFAELAPGAAFVFQAASPEALADHLDDLLGDPARLAAARAQAFRLGQDRFNWETEEAAFMACVDTALMPRGAGHA